MTRVPLDDEGDALTALRARLQTLADAEGGEMFMGLPDRWWEAHLRRCINDHVSTRVLKSEELNRDACLSGDCMAPLVLTFPEDVDGPLGGTVMARLLRWKAEALPLLALLDRCHDLLPPDAQAPLGTSKADAVERYLADRDRAVRGGA